MKFPPTPQAMAAMLFAALTTTDLASAENLVPNGGFEDGFTGWSNLAQNGASASYSLETGLPFAGAHALKAEIQSLGPNAWDVQTLGPTFTDLGGGRATTLTFRARAATDGTRVRFVMQGDTYRAQDFTLTAEWREYTWNHTSAENSPRLRIHYFQTGTIWLDEISLVADDGSGGNGGSGDGIVLTLDPSVRYQTMEGIGGALTWYSRRVLTSPHRATLEQLIFDDLGLDLIRLKNWYFPADYPGNPSPANIPASDRNYFFANQAFHDLARADGRDIRILFSSWTPPANLKSNGELRNGGTLAKDAEGNFRYADLAQYWVDLLDNMDWTPDYLSFQNEPGWVATWETAEFAPTETATRAGYAEALDAIWDRIKDRPDVPVMVGPESENMNAFFSQAAPLRSRPFVGAYAFHNYNMTNSTAIDGERGKLNRIRDEFADRPNWMSEFSQEGFDWLQTARVIHNTLVEANSAAYVYWKLVWGDDSRSPNSSMIWINSSGSEYVVGPSYHAVKHFSRHISRGFQRFRVAGGTTSVRVSGYIDPAASQITLVVLNTATTPATISLDVGELPVLSATAYQTARSSITSDPYQALGNLDSLDDRMLPAESITTYVLNLPEPFDPERLRITRIDHQGDRLALALPAQPGHPFSLWKSITLLEGSWLPVEDAIRTETEDGQFLFTLPSPANGRAFYRVQFDNPDQGL
jgi:glucuronoarabinoxylan endo-1,4-beta-xylanase